MNKTELLKMAITNLFRRKTRSILAILGVVIGTASIITMISIGLGMSKSFNDDMKKNPDIHMIEIWGVGRGDSSPSHNNTSSKALKMNDKSVQHIKTIKGVTQVTGVKDINVNMIIGDYISNTNLKGLEIDFMNKVLTKLSKGRMMNKSDKFKLLIGKEVPMQFQNYRTGRYIDYSPTGEYKVDLLSKKVEITSDKKYKQPKNNSFGMNESKNDNEPKYDIFKFESIGVIDSNGSEGYSIYTSLDTVKQIEKINSRAQAQAGMSRSDEQKQEYSSIMVYIEDINSISSVVDTLKSDGFQFYSIMDAVKQEQKRFAMIQGALGGIGGISLLVAAIGITNTMIMSIYERTREIGVMKVIGASLKDIRSLFLYEAANIGLIGGILGTILSVVLSMTINFFYAKLKVGGNMGMGMGMNMYADNINQTTPYISYIPIWLIFFGILFSTIIGVLSGYIPAKKAMSLSALESLRND